jgi:hypothetical protein
MRPQVQLLSHGPFHWGEITVVLHEGTQSFGKRQHHMTVRDFLQDFALQMLGKDQCALGGARCVEIAIAGGQISGSETKLLHGKLRPK